MARIAASSWEAPAASASAAVAETASPAPVTSATSEEPTIESPRGFTPRSKSIMPSLPRVIQTARAPLPFTIEAPARRSADARSDGSRIASSTSCSLGVRSVAPR